MIGRGTRLCPDLYGPGQHKQDFYVFDCCRNFEYFSQDVPVTEGSLGQSLTERLFRARLELVYRLDQRLPADAEPETDGTRSEAGLRWDVAHHLHERVTASTRRTSSYAPGAAPCSSTSTSPTGTG